MTAHQLAWQARTRRRLPLRRGAAFLVAGLSLQSLAASAALARLAAQEAVPTISHGAEDTVLDWRFERRWTVGGAADTLLGRDYAFRFGEVDVDSRNRIYVLQQSDHRVVVLSDAGEMLDEIGRSGRGPGELADPHALSVAEDSILSVYDWTNGVVRWRLPAAESATAIRAHVQIWTWELHVGPGGFVFTEREALRGGPNGMYRHHVSRWTPAGVKRLVTGPTAERVISEFPSCDMTGMSLPRIFEPGVPWDARDHRLVAVADVAYDIQVFEDFRPVMRIKRDIAPRGVTKEMAERHFEVSWGGRVRPSCKIPADEAVRRLHVADHLQTVTDVRISRGGNVWALRGKVADEPSRTDVFTSGGEYLGTLPPGSPFPVAMMSDDRILVADKDAYDVGTLTMYRIVRR